MTAEQIRHTLRHQPSEPFRLVMTDGTGHEIRHPDLLMVGQRTAMVGLTGDPAQTFYERAVKIDLVHVIRLEPLSVTPPSQNGPGCAPHRAGMSGLSAAPDRRAAGRTPQPR